MEASFEKLINLLTSTTKTGIMKWEKTSNPKEYLSTTIVPSPVGIYQEDNASTNTPAIVFYILDEKGNDTLRMTKGESEEEYTLLRSLYETIQSKDEDINKIITDFLERLKLDTEKK